MTSDPGAERFAGDDGAAGPPSEAASGDPGSGATAPDETEAEGHSWDRAVAASQALDRVLREIERSTADGRDHDSSRPRRPLTQGTHPRAAPEPSSHPIPSTTAEQPSVAVSGWPADFNVLGAMWRYRWLVAAGLVLGLLAGLLATQFQSPQYETAALLRLEDPRSTGVFETEEPIGSELHLVRQVDLIRSPLVMNRAAELIEGSIDLETLDAATEIEGDPELLTIEISAEASSSEAAAEIANAVSDAYEAVAEELNREQAARLIAELETAHETLSARIDDLEAQFADQVIGPEGEISPLAAARHERLVDQLLEIESRIQAVTIEAELIGSGVALVESASPPTEPAGPAPALLVVLGAIVGVVAAGGLASWQMLRGARVWSAAEAARILGVPLLGRLPTLRRGWGDLERVLDLDPEGREAYDFLLTSLEYELLRADGSSALLTSAAPQQGKTTATIHLGLAAARTKRDVLLVDGDLRSQRLTDLFELSGAPGLSELGLPESEELVQTIHDADEPVKVLPAGHHARRSRSFLRDRAFQDRFAQLCGSADVVLVDSAPLLAAAETTVLSGSVDGVVLIVPARTPTRQLTRVRERAGFMPTPVIGFIYVGDDPEASHGYYGYGLSEPSASAGDR